jgi:hypothetical protein
LALIAIMPVSVRSEVVHRYSFTSDASDSIGGADGTIVDAGTTPNHAFVDGMVDFSDNFGEGSNVIIEDAYVDLPNGIVSAAVNSGTAGAVSFEWWATVTETHTWQRFGDFGTSNNGEDTSVSGNASEYVIITPNSGRYGNGLEITNHPASNAAEPNVGLQGPFPLEEEAHVVAVYDHSDSTDGPNGTMYMYMDGDLIGSNLIHDDMNLTSFDDNNNWLGRSQWNDPVFVGSFNEFRIYDTALTAEDVEASFAAGPDAPLGGETRLRAGDADQDLKFDQIDLVQVQIGAKYLTGQPATWGDGDWNGAPGGSPGNPPPGNGLFDQLDIIAALNADVYLTGPYAAIAGGGEAGDPQTSIIYDPSTGEIAVDTPNGVELTSINIDSSASIFTGDAAQNLGGSFDNDADNNIFKATFGSSFGGLSFGNVAQAGLSEEFVLGDLTVIGSLNGGGDLGEVDLIYVPEPSAVILTLFGVLFVRTFRRRDPQSISVLCE